MWLQSAARAYKKQATRNWKGTREMAFRPYKPGDRGPLGRRPTVQRAFERCPCGGTVRIGRVTCDSPSQHAEFVSQQQQRQAQSNASAAQLGDGPDAPHLESPGTEYKTPGGPVGIS